MAHLGPHAFDTIGGEIVSATAFVVSSMPRPQYAGSFFRLTGGASEAEKDSIFHAAQQSSGSNSRSYRISAAEFMTIPGIPIAYWVSSGQVNTFTTFPQVGEHLELKAGISTGDNSLFERFWFEVGCLGSEPDHPFRSRNPLELQNVVSMQQRRHRGKWYGNHDTVMYWRDNGARIRNFGREEGRVRSAVRNETYYFREGITWSKIGTGRFAARWRPKGFLFDDTGRCGFADEETLLACLGLFCSKVATQFWECCRQR